MDAVAIVGIIFGAVATAVNIILAVVAVLSLRHNYKQIQETQKQALETQQDLQRPFLIPTNASSLAIDDNHPDWTSETQAITMRNVGAGIATNIRGCILGSVYSQLGLHGFTIEVEQPIPKDELLTLQIGRSKPLPYSPSNSIDGYELVAPQGRLARLTLTYQDVFGKKHASIFDLDTMYAKVIWVHVAFSKGIPKSLADLQAEAEYRKYAGKH